MCHSRSVTGGKGRMDLKAISVILLLSVAFASAASKDRNNKKYKVVCYLGSWANYRPGAGKFLIEHIDPFLCTHVIYGFAKLAGNKIAAYDPYLDLKENWGLGAFQRFNALKKANPNLTTLIAIGGWNEGSKKYSEMAANPAARATFIQSVISFCEKYGFDGLDMDWEYPANRGGKPEDKENFVALLRELKAAFASHGYLLTAAVSAGVKTMDTAYNIPEVSKYLDFINVMAYDLHGSWEKVVGHNAPMRVRPEEKDDERTLNVEYAINYWINKGAPRNKIVLGMGLYGRSFTLTDPSKTDLGSPAKGPGRGGPITKEPGMLGYNEICLNLKQGWKEVVPDKVDAPYAYSGDQWVGYDDKKSIGIKVDYLIKEGLGGGMVWSLETDDFRGNCYGEKYPLLAHIYTKLNGPVVRPTINPNIRPTVGPKPTGKPKGFTCPGEGYFRDPHNCSVFHYCVQVSKWEMARHTYNCGADSAFDEASKTCVLRKHVPGC
nr:chitinase-3-like protein 1 isoform X1 [Parasteatoda tepidariorum]XP_042910582.1 chitinase-3-like protein 1 isoform X2 [Parasteatoda tepidariorum]